MMKKQNGFILPLTLVLIIALMVATTASIAFSLQFYRDTERNPDRSQALLAAEAGIEFALQELNQTPQGDATVAETNLAYNETQGRVTYQTSAVGGDQNERTIISTGRVYIPADADEPVVTRRVESTVVGTSDGGAATVRAGQRLTISGGASIANGTVNVNGTLVMSGGTRIGTAQTPVNVNVAHNSCPTSADATYPRACTAGQPISITYGQSIFGEVKANNQTTGQMFMKNPGLTASSGVSSQRLDGTWLLTTHNRDTQKAAVQHTISASAASCTSGNGTRTWQANTRITSGNVNISSNCKVTILGNVWIEGNLNLSGDGDIRVSPSLSSRPDIMIDGSNGLNMSGSGKILANNNDVGVRVLTYYSTASCSPECDDVSGASLASSETRTTINLSGGNNNAPASTFHAVWTQVNLGSGVSVGSLVGQRISMSGAGNVTFGGDLSSGEKVWTIKNYRKL